MHVLKFGVRAESSPAEREFLSLADSYRLALYTSHMSEHRETIELRNSRYPELYAAMIEHEAAKALVSMVERDIKTHHSDVRDRNAVPPELEQRLKSARERRDSGQAAVRTLRRPWDDLLLAFRLALAGATNWKNVKTLEKRRAAYAELDWGELRQRALALAEERVAVAETDTARKTAERRRDALAHSDSEDIAALAEIVLRHDMHRRIASRDYQSRGLHSGTRGEIDAATEPKLSKTGPGFRYRYHDTRLPAPWRKIVLQFPGGLTVADALAGKSRQLRLSRHGTKRFTAEQQIGTKDHPQLIRYVLTAHRPLEPEDVIQRWALVVDQRPDDTDDGRWARSVHVTVTRDLPAKSLGTDTLCCRLSWTRCREGLAVAHFWSPLVNERLILPEWLVRNRLLVSETQALLDAAANEFLDDRGVQRAQEQGLAALDTHCREHTDDDEAARRRSRFVRTLRRARHVETRAVRTIEKIYETAAFRLAQAHGQVWLAPLDLLSAKRYDTRDLLREDVLPAASRTYLTAAAPGKLKQALLRALPEAGEAASGDVLPREPGDARETDVFRSYVRSLGPRGGRVSRCRSRRSQGEAQCDIVQEITV